MYLLKESEEEKKGRKRKKKDQKDGPFFFLSLNQIFLHNTLEYEEDEGEEHYCCDYYFYRERAERLQTGRYFLLFLVCAIFSRREKRKKRTF